MRKARAGIVVLVALLVVPVAAVTAGAVDDLPPAHYVDGTIMAWSPKTGETRWVARPGLDDSMEVGAVGPSVVVARVGQCDDDGLIAEHPVGLDSVTGKRLWSSKSPGWVSAPDLGSGIAVVTAASQRVVGLSATTGVRKWAINGGSFEGSTDATVLVRTESAIVAHDRATGLARWTFPISPPLTPFSDTVTVAAANEDFVVIARGGFLGRTGTLDGVSKPFAPTTLFTLDARTGDRLHRMVVADPELGFSRGVLRNGILVLINGAEINGIKLAAGRIVWRHAVSPGQYGWRGALTSDRGGVTTIFTDPVTRGTLALNTVTGATRWDRPTFALLGRGTVASTLYLIPVKWSTSRRVQGVDVSTGTTRWTRKLRSDDAIPQPALGHPGIAPMSVACGTP